MSLDRNALKALLATLMAQYETADEARRKAIQEMLKVQTAIRAIYALATDEPLEFSGSLADACREALKNSTAAMTPVDVRNAIVALGYNLTKHKNPLASIHSVLKRLHESGSVKQIQTAGASKDSPSKSAYQWTPTAPPASRPSSAPAATPLFTTQREFESIFGNGAQLAALVESLNRPISPEFKRQMESMAAKIADLEPAIAQQLREVEKLGPSFRAMTAKTIQALPKPKGSK